MPTASVLTREPLLRLTLVDLEDVPSVVLSEVDRECLECGDYECDGDAHWSDETEDYVCEDCGYNDCQCGW